LVGYKVVVDFIDDVVCVKLGLLNGAFIKAVESQSVRFCIFVRFSKL